MRFYRTFSPLPAVCTTGGLFSVALSVGTPRGVAARVYLKEPAGLRQRFELRGIAPFGVRTFLPRPLARTGAILRPSKTESKLIQPRARDKARTTMPEATPFSRLGPCETR